MPKDKKATQDICAERVNIVTDLVLMKMRRPEIMAYVLKKYPEWNLCTRQIDNYISKAQKAIKDLSVYERSEKIGEAIGDLHLLYRQLAKRQDYRGALAVRKEINDLLGLKEAVRVVIDSKNINLNSDVPVTEEELKKLIQDLNFVAAKK